MWTVTLRTFIELSRVAQPEPLAVVLEASPASEPLYAGGCQPGGVQPALCCVNIVLFMDFCVLKCSPLLLSLDNILISWTFV